MAFTTVQAQDMQLAGSGIGITDVSITIQVLAQIDGTLLTMADFGIVGYAVLEPGTSREESIKFSGITQNANGTGTLTGVTRGLLFVSPYTQSLPLRKQHAGNALLRFSNTSAFYNEFVDVDSNETVTGTWTFTNPNYPRMDTAVPPPTDDEQLAPKKYVDDIAIAGAPDATTTVKGIVQIPTPAEVAAGTNIGTTGASLAVRPGDLSTFVQNPTATYAVDSSGTDAYAITLTPAILAYADGQQFTFKAGTANTGTATLNVNGLGAIVINKNHDQILETGDIEAGGDVIVVYDSVGPKFQMLSQQNSMLSTANMTTLNTYITNNFFPTNQVIQNFIATTSIDQGDIVYASALGQVGVEHAFSDADAVNQLQITSVATSGGTNDAIRIAPNKYLIAYSPTGGLNQGLQLFASTFNASTNTFTAGAGVGGAFNGSCEAYVSDNIAIIGYETGGTATLARATLVGNVVTLGAGQAIESTDPPASRAVRSSVCMLTTGLGIYVYPDNAPTTDIRCRLFTLAGAVITSGNVATLSLGAAFTIINLTKIDSDHAIMIYYVGTSLRGVILTHAAGVITVGTPVVFSAATNANVLYAQVKVIDAANNKWVVAADDAYIITVNVAGGTFTENSTISISTTMTGASVMVQNERYFTTFYRDSVTGTSSNQQTFFRNSATDALTSLDTSGISNTQDVGVGPRENFSAHVMEFSPDRVVLVFDHNIAALSPAMAISTVGWETTFYDLFVGIADADAAAGATVPVVVQGTATNVSEVTSVENYYMNYGRVQTNPLPNGDTEDQANLIKIGVGVDTNSLLLQP